MRVIRLIPVLGMAVAGTALGCGEVATAPEVDPDFGRAGHRGGPRLAVYGVGGSGAGCAAAEHRQFDFWVGLWDVENPAAIQVGTNGILDDLNGCLVNENWTGGGGGRGRSLNMYDGGTGQWHQRWVDEFGTNLRLDGGIVSDAMILSGIRNFPNISIIDRITWTALEPDLVRQLWEISLDGGETFTITAFDGRYMRRDEINPVPSPGTTFCAAAPYDEFDFWVGDWDVTVSRGKPGHSSVTSQLSECLVEEVFTAGDYRSVTWVSYDALEGMWFRNSIDNDGQRMQLSGSLQNGLMVMTGEEQLADGSTTQVRVTWHRRGKNLVRQQFETQREDGRWREDVRAFYRRK